MTPIRRIDHDEALGSGKDTPYWIVIDLTVQGVLLAGTMKLVRGHFDDFTVSIIACFLAAMMLVRILFGSLEDFREHFLSRLGALVAVVVFAGWLFHEATNVRTGWYRTHVLQDRVGRIVSQAPAYIVLWDTQGNITEASSNIHFLTGYRRTELIGQPMTTLLQPKDRAGYRFGMTKATQILRRSDTIDAGWLMQGIITVGLLHKDSRVVPVKAYSGGIRWSQSVQFEGDTDLFAVFVPASLPHPLEPTTIDPKTPVQVAPPPPPTKTLVPSEVK